MTEAPIARLRRSKLRPGGCKADAERLVLEIKRDAGVADRKGRLKRIESPLDFSEADRAIDEMIQRQPRTGHWPDS